MILTAIVHKYNNSANALILIYEIDYMNQNKSNLEILRYEEFTNSIHTNL